MKSTKENIVCNGESKDFCSHTGSLEICSTHDFALNIDVEPVSLENTSVNAFLAEAEIVYSHECHPGGNVNPQENMRNKLKYFFMNPLQKWNAKRKFPWKLVLQIVKIILVTLQIVFFGMQSSKYVQQHHDMTMSLNHIFLEDWSSEPVAYPPSSTPYVLYTIPDFYNNVNHVIRQYSKIMTLFIGPYTYDSTDGSMTPMDICIKWYKGEVFAFNSTIFLSNEVDEMCVHVPILFPPNDPMWDKFSFEEFLHERNFTINFNTLVAVNLKFYLKSVLLKSLSKLDFPECYRMSLFVTYDNSQQDGQLHTTLKVRSLKLDCNVDMKFKNSNEKLTHMFHQFFNCIVIVMCLFSTILCSRSLHSGQMLRLDAAEYFKKHFGIEMSLSEHFDFVNLWYVMIIISDILIICGSVTKMNVEFLNSESSHYNKCTVLFGVGNLLLWAGLLRYLGFFPKYNMLILTLKQALPNVMRFMVCAVLLYAGFCLCGWIVLGPYHIKFQTISSTSECLFSIMNGDDMFATFALINTNDKLIWWFSRFYLYTFIALFIYVVISLFISLIMDTFETIKTVYIHGSPPKTTVSLFLSCELFPHISESQECNYVPNRTWSRLKKFFSLLYDRLKKKNREAPEVP